MNPFSRLVLLTFLSLGLAVVVGAVLPGVAASIGLDFRDLPELQRQLEEGQRTRAELESREAEVLARLDTKEQIVTDLLAGRLTLLTAAARFHALTANVPGAVRYLRFCYEGRSDEERYCRQVISWVRTEALVMAPPEVTRVTLRRLEAELQQHLDSGEPITFPD
jgi:hypothetical protein